MHKKICKRLLIFALLIPIHPLRAMTFHWISQLHTASDQPTSGDRSLSDDESSPIENLFGQDEAGSEINSDKLYDYLDDLKRTGNMKLFSKRIKSPKYASWKDCNGNTLLHYLFALMNHEGFRKPIDALIAQGADINAQNCTGQTPLHFLKYWHFCSDTIQNYKVQLATQDAEGKTVLEAIFPSFNNFLGSSELEQFKDWPVDLYDTNGYTILHRICMTHANWRNAYHFLKRGAKPNARTKNALQATALHLAAYYHGDTESRWAPLCSGLLEFGADAALRDGKGNTAFDIMMHQSRERTLLWHAERGSIGEQDGGGALFLLTSCGTKLAAAKNQALSIAARKGHIEFMHLLLDHGANVPTSAYSRNPLHDLALWYIEEKKHLSQNDQNKLISKNKEDAANIVARLIAAGANINAQFPSIDRSTPLHLAVANNCKVIAQVFLEHGADPNSADKNGLTPFNLTLNSKMIELLIDHGARVDTVGWGENLNMNKHCKIFYNKFYEALARFDFTKNDAEIRRMLDQAGNQALCPLEQGILEIGYSIETYNMLHTHPLPGPVFEDKKLAKARESWLTFLHAFTRMKNDTGIWVPRDIRRMITRLILPPTTECIAQVPTKLLHCYAPFYGKGALLTALINRHVEYLKKIAADLAKEPCRAAQTYGLQKWRLDEAYIETTLKPLTTQEYEKIFHTQKESPDPSINSGRTGE